MNIKYKVVNKIIDADWPHEHPDYQEAHAEASAAEKKKYPKGYEELKHLEKYLPDKEYFGINYPDGRIEVSKKVPERYREEVAYHEYIEHLAFQRLNKKYNRKFKE